MKLPGGRRSVPILFVVILATQLRKLWARPWALPANLQYNYQAIVDHAFEFGILMPKHDPQGQIEGFVEDGRSLPELPTEPFAAVAPFAATQRKPKSPRRTTGSVMADIVTIGGGIAGCATALALQRQGLSTLILERTAPDEVRVGEHLPPDARLLLSKLGLWDAFIADEHLPCPGVRASWGSPGVYEREYIFSPYGDGWNLDRRRFDASLVEAVRTAGGVVLHNAHVGAITAQEHGWSVEAIIAGQPQVLTAAFLVDATGRAAAVARRLGGRQVVHDHLIAVMGWMRAGDGANTSDATLLIEAAEDGWWYTTLLPGERLLAAFMTSPPLAARKQAPWRAIGPIRWPEHSISAAAQPALCSRATCASNLQARARAIRSPASVGWRSAMRPLRSTRFPRWGSARRCAWAWRPRM